MPQIYPYSYSEAARAEEMIPSMTYAVLVANLRWLTDIGVLSDRNPVSMLVAARIVDRSRIERSGLSVDDLRAALDWYRSHRGAVRGIVLALEQAVETAKPPA
jgi:hypothetical protein